MKNNNQFKIVLCMVAFIPLSFFAVANQQDTAHSPLSDNQVVVNVDFKVTEAFSGLSETSSTQKQMVMTFDKWQSVTLDRYDVKYKVIEQVTENDETLYMIDTQIVNSRKKVLHSPGFLTKSNKTAGIEVKADTKTDPSFKLNFSVLKE